MEYQQKNPIPLPASGAFSSVASTIDSVFDWQYALEQKGLLALYEKGKANNWNATELDWSADVSVERMMREREDFVIEASHLLRERLLMDPVFERMGLDVPVWVDWANGTPFMKGFRQMTFSKIVPNLKRLGLLTPRVRDAFGKMDLLRFEHLKDSVEQAEPEPPEELVKLLMEFLVANADGEPTGGPATAG
jgi:hypothetical protein